MNKIFKVIYSKTRHCYVVVSELAKSHCKITQSHTVRSKTALTAAVLIALGGVSFITNPGVAYANMPGNNAYYLGISDANTDRKDHVNADGKGAGGTDSITIGHNSTAATGTITIGDRSAGGSMYSVYLGEHYTAANQEHPDTGKYVTSIGYDSDAKGTGSIALGSGAEADVNRALEGDEKNPDAASASVAIGYKAKANQNNIAIGAGSVATATASTANAYLTNQPAVSSYVSVGGTVTTTDPKTKKTTTLRRITNVADGASASDVATVGQLQALSKEVGSYKKGFGIKIDADSTDNTKNTISLDRNLGKDYDTTDDVNLKNDAAGTSLILGGRVEKGSPTGGQSVTGDYGALGKDSVTVGGVDNTVETTGDAAVVVGGIYNKAAGTTSAVVGGSANDAIGNESAVFGGQDNDAYETYATISGGSWNKAYGKASSIFGGSVNDVSGRSSVAVGGYGSHVYGDVSVGIAGGSTNADYALAAGNEATVTVQNGTAIGYQATANKEGTVAFGHDNGDVYYTSTWPQKATEKEGKYYDAQNNEITKNQYEALRNADLTFNDYSQKPIVTENKYDAAGYNRLVKVADGVDAHDVVVMEQLNQATNDLTKDLSVNAGWGINIADEKDPKTGEVTKNVISLNRNLGKNYGNTYGGKGKVNFEADGENSLILGGEAINNSLDYRDKDFSYGAHAKDSVLVGGMNNDIDKNSERALIVGGTYNKTLSTGKVQQTGTDAIIVGGSSNKAEGDGSLLIGGDQNEASGLNSTIIGGLENKNESWDASILGGYYNQITGISQASGIFGGDNNKVVNSGFTYILGGENNIADGGLAVIVGGINNRSSGLGSSVFGGTNNIASGAGSSVIGGEYNAATNTGNVISGGFGNLTSGDHAYAAGGTQNYVTGMVASSLGGIYSSVNGMFSTGVAGGSTGQEAFLSLAAGYQSVVADGGAEKTYLTGADAIKVLEDMYSGKKLPGYYMRDFSVETGPDNPGRLIHYDKFSTALGYQATANKPGTIAFGHDAGDESGYTYEWETLTDEKGNPKQNMVDGTTNDYTKAPKSMKKNAPYTSAYYNRLVKVADGIDDHDVVVMEQLKQYAEKDASNIGNNLTVAPVYQTDDQGNVKTDSDNKPLVNEEATAKKVADAQAANKNDWGQALGAGTFSTANAAKDSEQLVTGKTLYNYDAPVVETGKTLNYVSANNTTGQNLSALDAQVKANADELNKPNRNIKYYSVKTLPLTVDGYTNEKNDGAKGMGSLAAGFVTHADGIASTVAGSYSGVINSGNAQGRDLRGAAALSYGTFNVNQNTDTAKEHSGVANSIVGQANMTTDSNAAIIYGAGNTVTNSYRPIDKDKALAILGNVSDQTNLSKAMQDAVKESGGQVMVMGGGNNVESAYMSQVVGVGNTVKGNQVKDDKKEWVTDTSSETAIKDYDPEKSSQYNYVDGFNNEVINGKHDYIIGANNKLDGDSYDDNNAKPIKRSNKSNVVIGDNHALTGKKNNVIIGSADTEGTLTRASDAVIIGHDANATSDTGADNAVAIGLSATAGGGNAVTIGVNTSAGDNSITIGSESSAISGSNIAIGRYARVYGDKVTKAVALGQKAEAHVADGVAIGSGSIATVAGNSVEGYDPTTGQDSTDGTATWKATNAAVSIGTADGKVTRQINGVAAGTNDTDAVNVAQLKKLGDNTVQYDLNTQKGKITLAGQDGTTITNVKSALDGAKDAEGNIATIATATGDALKNAANLGDLQKVYNDINTKAENASASHTALTVEGNTPAGKGKDEKTKEDVYAGKNILLHESTDENGKVTYDLKLAKDISIGKPGKNGEDGKIGIDGRDGHIGLNGSDGITVRGLDGENGTPGKDGVTITGPKGEAGKDGIDGKVGISGKDGKDAVSISGKDGVGHIGLTGPAGTNGMNGTDGKPGTSIDITVKNGYDEAGKDGKDGINGKNGVDGTSLTRIVYEDKNGKHQVATLEDGLKFKGDDSTVIAKKLNNTLDIIGGAKGDLTEGNIGVNSTTDGKKTESPTGKRSDGYHVHQQPDDY